MILKLRIAENADPDRINAAADYMREIDGITQVEFVDQEFESNDEEIPAMITKTESGDWFLEWQENGEPCVVQLDMPRYLGIQKIGAKAVEK